MSQRTLVTCLALAGLGHAALLWAVASQAPPHRPSPHSTGAAAIQVREVTATPFAAPAATAAARVAQAQQPIVVPTEQDRAEPAQPMAQPHIAESESVSEPVAAPAITQPDDGRFWPRNWLDQPPTPRSVIDLPYPEDAPIGRFRAVYTLFIGADGRVLHLRVEGPELPRALDEAARQAFLGGQFEPGRKDGRAVRSHMQIELNYDASQPLVAPPDGAASGAAGAAAPPAIDAAR